MTNIITRTITTKKAVCLSYVGGSVIETYSDIPAGINTTEKQKNF